LRKQIAEWGTVLCTALVLAVTLAGLASGQPAKVVKDSPEIKQPDAQTMATIDAALARMKADNGGKPWHSLLLQRECTQLGLVIYKTPRAQCASTHLCANVSGGSFHGACTSD
jgi:hypothetical protein